MHRFSDPYSFERADAIRQSRHSRYFHPRKINKTQHSDFSHLNQFKLNKNKKNLIDEQKNTEIDRSNRILYEKLAKCAMRSQPTSMKYSKITKKSRKVETMPHSPQNNAHRQSSSRHKSKDQPVKTLFMGHQHIDGVQFKIKLLITNQTYYLVAENQHTRIFLEIPEQEYWELHYNQLHENPCNIFQYLQIEKGRIQFRTAKHQQSSPKKEKNKYPKIKSSQKPGLRERGKIKKNLHLPKI